jgi:hypothetical protein
MSRPRQLMLSDPTVIDWSRLQQCEVRLAQLYDRRRRKLGDETLTFPPKTRSACLAKGRLFCTHESPQPKQGGRPLRVPCSAFTAHAIRYNSTTFGVFPTPCGKVVGAPLNASVAWCQDQSRRQSAEVSKPPGTFHGLDKPYRRRERSLFMLNKSRATVAL